MVFQSYALYPHMTVAQNIGFPLKMVGIARRRRSSARSPRPRAKVGIGHLLQRTPGQLSGGQQQRCALARAIVRQPRLFLLDEPLSNLDAKLRLETRLELHALQRSLGATTVYVTHDQEEAMTLADRIAVFMDGRIVQVGTPREVFARPATIAVAGFIGTPPMNLLAARVGRRTPSASTGHRLPVGADSRRAAPTSMLGVRPATCASPTAGSPRASSASRISATAHRHLRRRRAAAQARRPTAFPPIGKAMRVRLRFAPEAAHLFDPESGERLTLTALHLNDRQREPT